MTARRLIGLWLVSLAAAGAVFGADNAPGVESGERQNPVGEPNDRLGGAFAGTLFAASAEETDTTSKRAATRGDAGTKRSRWEGARRTGNVIFGNADPRGAAAWGTDDYQLGTARLSGDTLLATVSFGGGCKPHEFTLVLDRPTEGTDPLQLPATLAHNANDDLCEAWLTEEVQFDLMPVKINYRPHGKVLLVLDDADPALTYSF